LTSYPDKIVAGRRIFHLGFLGASLAVTGGYSVAGAPLDRWIAAAVDDYRRKATRASLSGLVDELRIRLTKQREPLHRRVIHAAGYVRDGKRIHPEVYYLRNIRGRTPDGGYGRAGREFTVSEEFWSLDYSRKETKETLREGGARMYLDGFPERRIAYMLLHLRSHEFYQQLWRSSKIFRRPRSLDDIAALVDLDMRVAAAFLASSGRGSRRAADTLQVDVIPAPAGALRLT
jgi:hypothetical protein